jgi:SAM-dependent methyltransferase
MPFDFPDFSKRAQLTELMDQPCSYQEFHDCLRDLSKVNRSTFAYRPTFHWLEQIIAAYRAEKPLHIVDVGCGYGDWLRRIATWAARRNIAVKLTGIDLNPHTAQAAREAANDKPGNIEWISGDVFSYHPEQNIDLVISALFTHHLDDDNIVRFLRWMEQNARLGWLINDLHRAAIPYYSFKLLAKCARWHRFVQHDGPVSIRRGFRRADWSLTRRRQD